MSLFLIVIGMVMIVEGLPYFISPDSTKMVIEKMISMPNSFLRKLGFFLMALGLVLVYLSKLF